MLFTKDVRREQKKKNTHGVKLINLHSLSLLIVKLISIFSINKLSDFMFVTMIGNSMYVFLHSVTLFFCPSLLSTQRDGKQWNEREYKQQNVTIYFVGQRRKDRFNNGCMNKNKKKKRNYFNKISKQWNKKDGQVK